MLIPSSLQRLNIFNKNWLLINNLSAKKCIFKKILSVRYSLCYEILTNILRLYGYVSVDFSFNYIGNFYVSTIHYLYYKI